MLLMIIVCILQQKEPTTVGLKPPTFRWTAERANRLRPGTSTKENCTTFIKFIVWNKIFTYVRFPPHYRISQELTSKTLDCWILIVLANDTTAQFNKERYIKSFVK